MKIDGWKYYNHAAVPTCAPHEIVNLSSIKDKSIWQIDGKKPLMARWISDFDCKESTSWWYIIKDTPLILEDCKKKVRKELRKALDFIDVKVIDPRKHEDEIKRIYNVAVENYQNSDVPQELNAINYNENEEWIGAFLKENNQLIAYKVARLHSDYVEMVTSKADPEYLKLAPFMVMNYWQINSYINSKRFKYMTNGTRTVLHQTNYNDYLEEKFGFRKAYCHLNIEYRPGIKWIINCMYPFRKVIYRFDSISLFRKLKGILIMDEIRREQ